MRQEELFRGLAALLGLGALVLLIVVLGSDRFDQEPQQTIATALAIAFFTPLAAAGVFLSRRPGRLASVGALAALATLAAFAIVTVSIWSNDFLDDWRPATYSLLVVLAVGQVSVLLCLGDSADPNNIRLLRIATIIAACILTAMAISEISSPGPELDFKGMAVPAVVYGFGAITLLLFAALGNRPAAAGIALDHVGVPVADWERSGAFYRDVLGADARPAYADHTFAWDGSAASAIEHLHRHGVAILDQPASREGAGGHGQSVYFRDPAGRLVELIAYG